MVCCGALDVRGVGRALVLVGAGLGAGVGLGVAAALGGVRAVGVGVALDALGVDRVAHGQGGVEGAVSVGRALGAHQAQG